MWGNFYGFLEQVQHNRPLTIFAKNSISDVWQGSEYNFDTATPF